MALGVRDRLQAIMDYDDEVCDVVEPPGKPPASCGELFIGIWENGFTNDAVDSRDDRHALAITITRRTPFSPKDRESREAIHAKIIGLEVLADQIASLIHGDFGNTAGAGDAVNNYAILTAANNRIAEVLPPQLVSARYGFTEPLRFLSGTRTEKKNGDWFWGDSADAEVGRALTLFFGKARRIANLLKQS